MPMGPMALVLVLILTCFGFLDQTLARIGLRVRQVLAVLLLMLVGSGFTIALAPGLLLNVGTGLVPAAAAVYLVVAAGSVRTAVRTLSAALATAGAVYLVGIWFPPGQPTELNFFYIDAQHIFAAMAAVVGYAAGGTRRSAFAAAVLGTMLADVAHHAVQRWEGLPPVPIQVGGGGFWGTGVVAGFLALALADLLGEFGEPERARLTEAELRPGGGGQPRP